MKTILLAFYLNAFMAMHHGAVGQERKTQNIIIVTLDGYRWKELFLGADPAIIFNPNFVKDTTVWAFVDRSPAVSRQKLMPFFWNTIARQGQLYGNRVLKNKVNCANMHLLSYPGYSEMLVGFADPSVSSNDLEKNPNPTVLEFIHNHEDFENRVVAFTTWNAFPYILRESESGLQVNSGTDRAVGEISATEKWLNENQAALRTAQGSRYDAVTFTYAMEYLKRARPRVMFLGFDETDQYAHAHRYDEYLKSAHEADKMIGELWQWVQSHPDYKDKTTLLITTDHGRGNGKRNWKHHRLITAGSRQIWFAVIGPDTPAFGEMKFKSRYKQKQVAKTIAAFLGLDYRKSVPVGEVVQTMLAVPAIDIDDTAGEALAHDQ